MAVKKRPESADKSKLLETLLKNIDKSHGAGTIRKMGENNIVDVESYSTGSLKIDEILGVKGVPKGRIIEIYGPESSGKTTLALNIIANVQKLGGTAAFIDAEHALDPKYAKNIGVNIDNLIVSQPDYGEQALQVTEELTKSGIIDLIVIDSVAALTPKSEIDGEIGDHSVGVQARLMSQALRKLVSVANNMNTTIIFINQLRMKIGMTGYGSPEVTTGGNALKFYASVRIDIRRIQTIKKGEASIGNKVKVKIAKNKVAPPFGVTETEIYFGEGFSVHSEILDLAIKYDIIDKSGGWHSYGEKKLGNGRENVIMYLKENTEEFEEIYKKVLEKFSK